MHEDAEEEAEEVWSTIKQYDPVRPSTTQYDPVRPSVAVPGYLRNGNSRVIQLDHGWQ